MGQHKKYTPAFTSHIIINFYLSSKPNQIFTAIYAKQRFKSVNLGTKHFVLLIILISEFINIHQNRPAFTEKLLGVALLGTGGWNRNLSGKRTIPLSSILYKHSFYVNKIWLYSTYFFSFFNTSHNSTILYIICNIYQIILTFCLTYYATCTIIRLIWNGPHHFKLLVLHSL